MARPVKCRQCGNMESDREKVTKVENKGYYHIENCYDEYLKDIEFKKQEALKKDSLVEVIAQTHNLESYTMIPPTFYPFIEEMRNDSKLFGKLKKNYKNGIPYEAIEYTYEFCREKILWAKQNKEFKNTLSELKYGLAIVRNNLEDAKRHFSKSIKQNQRDQLTIQKAKESVVIQDKIKEVQKNHAKKEQLEGLDVSSLFD